MLDHGRILIKAHRLIKFNQKAWWKPYIDKAKNDFEKDLFKSMNNFVFGKTMENVRKHRDIKLVRNDKRRNYLTSEPNYHTKNLFSENLVAIEMNQINVRMNKSVYLVLSILDIAR